MSAMSGFEANTRKAYKIQILNQKINKFYRMDSNREYSRDVHKYNITCSLSAIVLKR